MAATPQSQAIEVTNKLISAAQQLMTVYLMMVNIDAEWTDDQVAAYVSKMSTVAVNTDGSLGAADATPNVAHPIDVGKYTSLGRAMSSDQIAQLKTILDGIVQYVGGQSVAAQPGARAILNAAVGG